MPIQRYTLIGALLMHVKVTNDELVEMLLTYNTDPSPPLASWIRGRGYESSTGDVGVLRNLASSERPPILYRQPPPILGPYSPIGRLRRSILGHYIDGRALQGQRTQTTFKRATLRSPSPVVQEAYVLGINTGSTRARSTISWPRRPTRSTEPRVTRSGQQRRARAGWSRRGRRLLALLDCLPPDLKAVVGPLMRFGAHRRSHRGS